MPSSRNLPALVALAGSVVFAAAPTAHAQSQDLFVSSQIGNTIPRFAGTGPGTFSPAGTWERQRLESIFPAPCSSPSALCGRIIRAETAKRLIPVFNGHKPDDACFQRTCRY